MRCAWINAAALWAVFTAVFVYCGSVRAFHLHGWHLAESALAGSFVCFWAAGFLAHVIDYIGRNIECR